MKKLLIFFWVTLLAVACQLSDKPDNKISIEINADSEVIVEDETVSIENLQDVLIEKIKEIESADFKRDDIVTSMRVDKSAKMGTVSDVMKTMQGLNLSRIEYSNPAESGA